MNVSFKIAVTYEDVDGEVKSLTTGVHVTTGTTRQQVVLDIVKNGFRIEADRGIFRHIPPHRLVQVTYSE